MTRRAIWHLEHLQERLAARQLATYLDYETARLDITTADLEASVRAEPRLEYGSVMSYVMTWDGEDHVIAPVANIARAADVLAAHARTRPIAVNIDNGPTYLVGEQS